MSRVINLQGGGRAECLSALIRVNAETGSTVSCNGVAGTEKQVLNPEWRNLPSGYTELEYIRSTGTQVIDSTVSESANISVELTVLYGAWSGSFMFGSLYSNIRKMLFATNGTNAIQSILGTSPSFTSILNTSEYANQKVRIKGNLTSPQVYYLNDVEVARGTVSVSLSGNSTHLIFAARDNVSGRPPYGYSSYTLYECKIWDYTNNNLLRDLIPCKRNSDSAIGMYDTVANEFHANVGSGTFEYGAEVPQYIGGQWDFPVSASLVPNPSYRNLPSGYKQVEYIQSSGSQYIDTNYIPKNTSGFNVKIITTSYNTYNSFGSSGSNNLWGFGYVGSNHDYYVYWLNAGGAGYLASAWSLDEEHLVSVNYKNSRTNYLDGVQVGTISSTISPSLTAYLFATNVNNSPVEPINAKLISVEFTEDANTVRDLVPCLNESTNKYGLYDMVSNSFFGNSGTGDFTGGEEVPQFVAPTYTVTATKGSKSASQVVQVDYVGLYEVTLTYIRNGLVAEYLFESNLNDTSGNGYNLTNTNVTFGTTGLSGFESCAVFNGSNSYAMRNGSISQLLGTSYSCSVWVKSSTSQDDKGIVMVAGQNSGSTYSFYFSQSLEQRQSNNLFWNTAIGSTYQGVMVNGSAINDGTWRHCVIVMDIAQGTRKMYVNGQLVASGTTTGGLTHFTYLILGSNTTQNSYGNNFNGSIACLRLYNRALDSSDIASLYNSGKGR